MSTAMYSSRDKLNWECKYGIDLATAQRRVGLISVDPQMCLNPALAIHSGDMPPPLYICSDCADYLRHDQGEYMVDLLLPMPHVSTTCENKVRGVLPASLLRLP